VLKRECNRTNLQVQAVFKSADQARKLDSSADHSDPALARASKELDSHVSSFEGMVGSYQPLSVLKAHPVGGWGRHHAYGWGAESARQGDERLCGWARCFSGVPHAP
jgi:hypothetical protein